MIQPNKCLKLSAPESKLPELLVLLMNNVENLTIIEDEAKEFPYIKKSEFLSKDPITCAYYFDYYVIKTRRAFSSE
jgi:hypothetical protein